MNKDEKYFEEFISDINFDDEPTQTHRDKLEKQLLTVLNSKRPRHQFDWRSIMQSKITKLAAAAVIIVAVIIGINQFGGSIDAASVAWASVTKHIAQTDYVHVYYFKSRGDVFKRHFEAWYKEGRIVTRGDDGYMVYDDGQTEQGFTKDGKRTSQQRSKLANGQTFFEVFTAGLLSDKNQQLSRQIPANVGDDFLIYEFNELPIDDGEWIESVSITVGKNSLLPVQMKIYEEDGCYDMIIFDYEAPEKDADYFEPPIAASANCGGEFLLDGEEVILDIEGAPGLKQAIVRLHSRYDGPIDEFPLDYITSDRLSPDFCRAVSKSIKKEYKRKGGPIFRLDVTFVTDEGYYSAKNDIIVLSLNEAKQCGVGASDGGCDNWPDGKFRNIRFSPMLKPAQTDNTYIVEISCWIKTEEK